VVMRRTAIGQFGRPASDIVENIAEAMAEELGWSEEKKMREIASLDSIYRTAS
jgi:glycerol-3-phosphate dehydrogenase